jgi:hypothetical protein
MTAVLSVTCRPWWNLPAVGGTPGRGYVRTLESIVTRETTQKKISGLFEFNFIFETEVCDFVFCCFFGGT